MFRVIKAQQAAFRLWGGRRRAQSQLVGAPVHHVAVQQSAIQTGESAKVPRTFQQHLCVTCVLAHCSISDGQALDHAELMDSMPL